jgi:1-acyl-sn-glycerol-3-phosphate acyltransferase
MGPLIPDDSTAVQRWVRRARGIALIVVSFVLVTAFSPLLVLAALITDLALWLRRRKPWMALRMIAMLWWFLLGELYGLIGLTAIGAASLGRDSAARRDRVYRLKRRWLSSHLGAVKKLFSLRFESEGLECAGPGPVLVMTRHASIIDNTLPDVIIGGEHGIGFRFVIKRELRMLPTIDIGGRWVPTLFVRRASGDTAAELERMHALTVNLGPDDGLLLYPEGTRWTAAKLARAQEIVAERQPELAPLANQLRYLLPPRLGGALKLLDGSRAAAADVVVFGHFGLDGFEYISDIWAGGLVGTTVQMKFWRFAAAEIPAERDQLTTWLYARWLELDEWIAQARRDAGIQAVGKAAAPVL